MNALKIKAAVVESGYSQTALAKEMNMSKNTLNAKLNGIRDFTTSEVRSMCQILCIPKEQIPNIFFADNISN